MFVADEDGPRRSPTCMRPCDLADVLVFETRNPARKAWLQWNRESSYSRTKVTTVGEVEAWVEVTDVQDGLVSFRSVFVFAADGAVMTSHSTLRFRSRDEVVESLRDNDSSWKRHGTRPIVPGWSSCSSPAARPDSQLERYDR